MLSTKYVIRCDGGSKFREHYCGSVIEGSLKGALKAEARAAGWKIGRSFWGGTYICPACQAAARGEESGQ